MPDPNLKLSAVRAMAYAIRAIDQHLMTCHVFAPHSSRELIAKEDWLDFHMAQSYVWRDRIYPLVANDYGLGKPVGMSEPTYERAVQAAEFGYSFPDASVVRPFGRCSRVDISRTEPIRSTIFGRVGAICFSLKALVG